MTIETEQTKCHSMSDSDISNKGFSFAKNVVIHHSELVKGEPYGYAVKELQRLLARIGVHAKAVSDLPSTEETWKLIITVSAMQSHDASNSESLLDDAYRLTVSDKAVLIGSSSQKGALNGVYDLAERLGFFFVRPGEDGEWPPPAREIYSLPIGSCIMRPRFPHHGIFSGTWLDFGQAEWLRFFAKLRCNATNVDLPNLPLCRELGLRAEVGAHGLSSLLPREQFSEAPERFRMFQPEDFKGKRMPDANLCVGNLDTWKIIQENFISQIKTVPGAYAVHAWPDDLPAGGWCLCPLCRALTPTDQALLAMRCLAEAARKVKNAPRLAVIAYHDTISPGPEIEAPPEAFLLYAPRERCYAHALDDVSCPRNRFYLEALDAWIEKFKGIDDAHTFEYYFDQVLFRGLYPFLPNVIIEDMRVYRSRGIECHMSLQVAGPTIAPEFNMLVFARAVWDEGMNAESAIADTAHRISPDSPEAWIRYLTARSRIFADAMRMCHHNIDIYLDYRWLPETTHPFGDEMAATYERCAGDLEKAAKALESEQRKNDPPHVQELTRKEAGRARFEAAELRVMHHQQRAMNALGRYMNSRSSEDLCQGIEELDTACLSMETAREKALAAGLSEKSWYICNINGWLTREFKAKAANYRRGLPAHP